MLVVRSKLTSQYRISVPSSIRRKLAIGAGSILEWHEDGDQVIVRRAGLFTSEEIHLAVFKSPPAPRTPSELKDGVRRHVTKRGAGR